MTAYLTSSLRASGQVPGGQAHIWTSALSQPVRETQLFAAVACIHSLLIVAA